MPTPKQEVKVFVASPSDVKAERKVLDRVIQEINSTHSDDKGFVVRVVKWETDTYPSKGPAQENINNQIGKYDIFIGIMWERFGTPTGTAQSGTEEEFRLAYEEVCRTGKTPRIAFYFRKGNASRSKEELEELCNKGELTQAKLEQLIKVKDFREEISKKALIWQYDSTRKFTDDVRQHLYMILNQMFPSQAIRRPRPHPPFPNPWIIFFVVLLVIALVTTLAVANSVFRTNSPITPSPVFTATESPAPSELPISLAPTATGRPAPSEMPISLAPTATNTAVTNASQQISVVQQFVAPGRGASGITWDGKHLWLTDNSGTIFQMDTQGKVIGNFQSPEVTPSGIAWDGSSFWVFTSNHFELYQFQIAGRSTQALRSFQSPANNSGEGEDLVWDGKNMWFAGDFNLYKLDASGNVLDSFTFPRDIGGVDWDGSRFWLAYNDPSATTTLNIVDADGQVLQSFSSPIHRVTSLAWADGYLWSVGDASDPFTFDTIVHKLDVSQSYSPSPTP
jgi:hypothetical protein